QQAGDGLVDLRSQFGVVVLDVRVRVPRSAASTTVEYLHEAHSTLDEAPGDEALLAEGFALVAVQAVEAARAFKFAVELERFGDARLHLEGQFVRLDACPQVLVVRIIDARQPIELA